MMFTKIKNKKIFNKFIISFFVFSLFFIFINYVSAGVLQQIEDNTVIGDYNNNLETSLAIDSSNLDSSNTIFSIINRIINIVFFIGISIPLVYILWSGIRMVISRGDSNKLDEAKNTLNYALIGAVVVISFRVLLSILLNILGTDLDSILEPGVNLAEDKGVNPDTENTTLGYWVSTFIDIFYFIGLSLSLIFIIIGGIKYSTARGDSNSIDGAKKTITNALIGVVVVLGFRVISLLGISCIAQAFDDSVLVCPGSIIDGVFDFTPPPGVGTPI